MRFCFIPSVVHSYEFFRVWNANKSQIWKAHPELRKRSFCCLSFSAPSFQMLLNSADYCKQISSFSHIFCVGTMLTYAKYNLLLKYSLFL